MRRGARGAVAWPPRTCGLLPLTKSATSGLVAGLSLKRWYTVLPEGSLSPHGSAAVWTGV